MQYAYSVDKLHSIKNVSTDRIFVLKPINGKVTDVRGMVDKRLFTGGNKLHAVQDSGLWYLKYDDGSVPSPLRQRFTNFNQLYRFISNYYKLRNIEIVEVID